MAATDRHAPSQSQRRILEALASRADAAELKTAPSPEMYGLDLVAAGVASRSSLYVELARLEDFGWIEGREEDPAPPAGLARRVYQITSAGAAVLLPLAKAVP